MNLNDIARTRLASQQLAQSDLKSVKDVVGWMGAMQAQDYNMAKWAVGVRSPGLTNQHVQQALNSGEVIRTHVLRPTWHLVSADDVHWMLQLSGPRVKAFMKSRIKQLEISEDLFEKSTNIMANALAGNNHLTREELMTEINRANIKIDDLRGLHFLMRAELDGIICSGITREKNQTYALLDERVKKPHPLNDDEALSKLAERYFSSHGPATLRDFVWWSGLSISDARRGLEDIKNTLIAEMIDGQTFWMGSSIMPGESKSTWLLPAFDEFLISYTDRSAAIAIHHQSKAFTTNGIFKPVIVEDGNVTGTWKRTIQKDKIIIETHLFKTKSHAALSRISKAAKPFGKFLGKKVEIL